MYTRRAYTQKHAPHVRGNTVILYMAQRHAYVPSGMRRAAYVYVDLCARVPRLCVCFARARIRAAAHRDPRLPARLGEREEARTCTMHECVHTHTHTPDRAGFIPGGTSRRAETREECERKRAKRVPRRWGESRRTPPVRPSVRPRGPLKGLSRDRIFSISVGECVLTSIKIKINRRFSFD